MAHEFGRYDKGTFAKPAWHGLGKVFDRPMSTEEVIKNSSVCDYIVKQGRGFVPYNPIINELYTDDSWKQAKLGELQWIPTQCMFNFRTDLPLGQSESLLSPRGVGEGYEIVQNSELVDIGDAIIEHAGTFWESAGTLKNGKLVFLLARMPGNHDIGGDKVERYILLYSSHDGSKAIVVRATTIRVVCFNTLSAALEDHLGMTVELRHTENVRTRIEEAIRAVQLSKEAFEREKAIFEPLTKKATNTRFMQAYLKALYPDPPGENRRTSQAEKKRNRIMELAYGEQLGANGPGMIVNDQVSEWGLYNAVCQYWQYDSTSRARVDDNDPNANVARSEHRFENNVWGTQEVQRSRALDLLLNRESLENKALAVN